VLAACSAPAQPPIVGPRSAKLSRSAPRRPRPPCATIAGHCDRTIDDIAVFELVQQRCWACHDRDGLAGHDFATVTALRAAPVAEMVGTCQMPPDGAPLPDADRRRLVDWSRCQH
jgi:hypothetical protein